MPKYNNLDTTHAIKALTETKPYDITALDTRRIRSMTTPIAADLTYSYATAPVDDEIISALDALAKEQELLEKYGATADGEIMNTGENRRVLHHLLRGRLEGDVIADGVNLRRFYETQRTRFSDFAAAVRTGKERGATGKPFTTVVQIGIGGSDLGPRALYLALKEWARAEKKIGRAHV